MNFDLVVLGSSGHRDVDILFSHPARHMNDG